MSERWTALLVGCGRIGGTYNAGPGDELVMTHALAYHRHPGYALVAAVDPDPAARAAFTARWGVSRLYATLDEALAAGRYDIVSVAGPTSTHLDTLARLAAVELRAVFAEKPVGGDSARARPLVRRFAERDVAFAVNFQRRWDREMTALRGEIAAGEWGALRTVTGRYMRGVVNNAGHMVNILAYLLGEVPRPVAAGTARWDGVPGDPTVDATLSLADGTPIHLVGSDGRDYAVFDFDLCFARGVVSVGEFGLKIRRRRTKDGPAIARLPVLDDAPWTPTAYGEAMLRALDEIRDRRPGARLASDGESALETLAVNEALRDMATRGTTT